MSNRPKILVFHLLNDFSGSPKVLMQLLKAWSKKEFDIHLYTSNIDKPGFLSNIENIQYHKGWYVYSSSKLLRLVYYSLSQMILFFKMFSQVKKGDVIYINTVLPFGAAIIGKLKSCRVIYHIHESTISPKPLKWFLLSVVKWTAHDIINVSNYVAASHGIQVKRNHLLYNAIEDSFLEAAQSTIKTNNYKNVLMVCSLKAYKGVLEFVGLAKSCPQYSFKIVFNAQKLEIDSFFQEIQIPKNLEIFDVQSNLHPFYSWADVVVNLSRPDGWVETFGLTIIEGMAYSLPALVPPVGGIVEVIELNKTGFAVDSRNGEELVEKLNLILSDTLKYGELSANSRERIEVFRETSFVKKSIQILTLDFS
jgi:L-malate glycosyltransferase